MEKINIAEILKDCPKGMELDCTIFNDVTLYRIDTSPENEYPIRIETKNGNFLDLTKYGTYSNVEESKCVIFPKRKTTWEGFVPPCKFKNGDMFSNTEDDVRLRSTIQVLEYARSLDAYNQYGKVDIDKNIAWLEKQTNMKVSMKR